MQSDINEFNEMLQRCGFESSVDVGFVGKGWWSILEACLPKLKDAGVQQIVQIKEKFGSLRLYVSNSSELIRQLIDDAESATSVTCEFCGAPGSPRYGGWVKTLCDKCASDRSH